MRYNSPKQTLLDDLFPIINFSFFDMEASTGCLAVSEYFEVKMKSVSEKLTTVNTEIQIKVSIISSELINKAGKLFAIATTKKWILRVNT
jgi:hypothetical protein